MILFSLLIAASMTPMVTDQSVSFQTSDDVTVHGTLHLPDAEQPRPCVLLLHGGGQDRTEWNDLLPLLHDRGWATLAIDLRGHGQSAEKISDWSKFFNDPEGVPRDVEAAIEYLKNQKGIAADRIAIVGSSVGANLACVGVQRFGVRGGVFFSGKTKAAENLAGVKLDRLQAMYYIASENEEGGARAQWAADLEAVTAEPSRTEVVRGSRRHGMAVMTDDPTLASRVVSFLAGVLQGDRWQTIRIPASDDIEITVDQYQSHPENAPVIVCCHQARWSRGEYRETASLFATLGFNVIAVDQRSGEGVNEVVNETHRDAEAADKETGFLDAEADIVTVLKWARNHTDGPVVLLGSSYSASLALKIAGEQPTLVDGVLAFSPGEYFRNESETFIRDAAAKIACPAFISSARDEEPQWSKIFEAIPGKEGDKKSSFLPPSKSQHGSRALWAQFEDSKPTWDAVTEFLIPISRSN